MTPASVLTPLISRVPALAAPCRMHRSVHAIEAAVIDWTRRTGLHVDRRSACHRLAARAFAEFDARAAALFAQWLTWLFHLDDLVDEAGQPYPRLFEGTGAHPLEAAFTDLWRATSATMSDDWRLRFATNLQRQADACRAQADNRVSGRVPTVEEYPALRRGTAGPFLYDLVEPCLRVEVPPELAAAEPWQALVEACADVAAWCNDLASLPKERGDAHNFVVVVTHELDLGEPEAVDWVLDRIAGRCADMRAAARRLPLDELPARTARDVSKVACAYLTAPRAHLDWVTESERYT
ncbi:terpene synthase family protein [Nonomuraea sp. NPDC059194]|uniref:terpene synthase family protein n=1 Tax=Nonomuraea sp. NPDC059194 TaxID=3346764 RepID=UPI0036812E28